MGRENRKGISLREETMYINRELALPACLAGSFVWKCKQAKIASGNFSMKGIWLLVSTLFLDVKAASIARIFL